MVDVKIHVQLWSVNLIERGRLEVLDVGGRIRLKLVLKENYRDVFDCIYLSDDRDQ